VLVSSVLPKTKNDVVNIRCKNTQFYRLNQDKLISQGYY